MRTVADPFGGRHATAAKRHADVLSTFDQDRRKFLGATVTGMAAAGIRPATYAGMTTAYPAQFPGAERQERR